jgi:hypothetical protein
MPARLLLAGTRALSIVPTAVIRCYLPSCQKPTMPVGFEMKFNRHGGNDDELEMRFDAHRYDPGRCGPWSDGWSACSTWCRRSRTLP